MLTDGEHELLGAIYRLLQHHGIAVVSRRELLSTPMVAANRSDALDQLVKRGFLIESPFGNLVLTAKGIEAAQHLNQDSSSRLDR